jgi:hypothetical protein
LPRGLERRVTGAANDQLFAGRDRLGFGGGACVECQPLTLEAVIAHERGSVRFFLRSLPSPNAGFPARRF